MGGSGKEENSLLQILKNISFSYFWLKLIISLKFISILGILFWVHNLILQHFACLFTPMVFLSSFTISLMPFSKNLGRAPQIFKLTFHILWLRIRLNFGYNTNLGRYTNQVRIYPSYVPYYSAKRRWLICIELISKIKD